MSADTPRRPLAVLYEHPDWFQPLFAELERREIPFAKIHAASHSFDPGSPETRFAAVLNRMSPSGWQRGRTAEVLYTEGWLHHLEESGVRVLNGVDAWRTEISKARQLTLLERLGLPYPKARVLSDPSQAPAATEGLRFPVVVKPNIGGSGAGVRRFDSRQDLEAAVSELDFGIDHTGLVQEYIPPEDGHIVRVEVVGGRFLYAIAVHPPEGSFNLCPADACVTGDGQRLERTFCAVDAADNGLRVEGVTPPVAIQAQVEGIMAAAGIDIGGVEYVVDERDGTPYFYDINALSNFVADAEQVIGFDPFQRMVDWLEEELEAVHRAEVAVAAAAAESRNGASAHDPLAAAATARGGF